MIPRRARWLSLIFFLSAAATGADVYVSPVGKDDSPGTLDLPVKTVSKAQSIVRDVRSKEPNRATAIVVELRGGFYELPETWRLDPLDSGTEQSPTIYRAYNNETPVLSGGKRITGWQVGADGWWRVTLPEVAKGEWNFAQLFVNDQRRPRPRVPKHGYHHIAATVDASPAAAGKGFDRFGYANDEINPAWTNLRDCEVVAMHIWGISRLPIAGIDAANHVVQLGGHTCTREHYTALNAGGRYFVDNVKEALGEPGEWYLDRPTGELTYLPQPGETPENTTVIGPRQTTILEIFGDLPTNRFVEHVRFQGLTFAHSQWTLPVGGQSIAQAEFSLPAAVDLRQSRAVRFDGCAIRHTGTHGMAFGLGCRDCVADHCDLLDLGAGGVKIGTGGGLNSWGPDHLPQGGEPSAQNIAIRNSTVAHGGRLHPAACGVWIGHAAYNRIEHCDIFDFYYTGVSVGWVWGYAPSRAHHNAIEFNHIHTIGQRVLSDMGGVYTLGISPGTTVSDNVIHHIDAFDYGGWGLYTDEGSTEIVMENNLVHDTKTGGFHQHYGKDNSIRNNIFVNAAVQQLQRTRPEEHNSFTFEHNIVAWDNATPLFGGNWREGKVTVDKNIYWCTQQPTPPFFEGQDFSAWQALGHDGQSRFVDPQFVDAANGDYHLQPTSPAIGLGFKPFPYEDAGRGVAETIVGKTVPVPPKTFD